MISDKQLEANRRNAQRSTGPKTEEGKKRSTLNAYRHGLTGQISVRDDEEREAHDRFCDGIIQTLKPEGALEVQLAQSIAEDQWRLNRIRSVEDNIFALFQWKQWGNSVDDDHARFNAALDGAQSFLDHSKSFELLTTYETRLNRSFQRNLA